MSHDFRIAPNDPTIIEWRLNHEASRFGFYMTTDSPKEAKRILVQLEADELCFYCEWLARRTPLNASTILAALLAFEGHHHTTRSELLLIAEKYIWTLVARGEL